MSEGWVIRVQKSCVGGISEAQFVVVLGYWRVFICVLFFFNMQRHAFSEVLSLKSQDNSFKGSSWNSLEYSDFIGASLGSYPTEYKI